MSGAVGKPLINVAVAVVQRSDGRVLLAERPQGKVSGGCWEFPGGKFDAGEGVEQALARELHEEVGVELDRAHPWMTYEHEYPDKRVRLHFFRVLAWHGEPHGREGQRISWEDPLALGIGPLLPADARALQALSLPQVYAITQAAKFGIPGFLRRLERALQAGVRLILVRERELAPAQLAQFTRRVVESARRYGAMVLVQGDELLARKAGADGIHTSGRDLLRRSARPGTRLWSVSCHDSGEIARAADLGADFVVLSPVLPTATHPDARPLGWEGFRGMVRDCPVPVYALGGMRPDLLHTAVSQGAHGIALASGIW